VGSSFRKEFVIMDSKLHGILAVDLITRAEKYPDFPVITFENHPFSNEVLTYQDIVLKGNKLARAMEKMGIGRGDTFSVMTYNRPETVMAMYAASALGAVMVPIDPRSKWDKILYQIKDSGSKGLIFEAEFMDSVSEVLKDLPDVRVIGCHYSPGFERLVLHQYRNLKEILEGPEVSLLDPRANAVSDPFELIYTSGTTGTPKGIHIRYEWVLLAPSHADEVWHYSPNDKLYTGLSLSHGNAQICTLFPALYKKIPAVIGRKFTKSRIWEICRSHVCTTFSLLGGMMMGIYSEPPKPDDRDNPVRLVVSAGTPRSIWKAFENRFGVVIHEWYGCMEGAFAHNPPGVGPLGSFGMPLEDKMEMKVVREDNSECNPGEIGELITRRLDGRTRVEYHNMPEASAAKVQDGWLRTGDMVHRDEEGWFYFDFRKGGGLRRQGDFIMPEYVENVLSRHPDVIDVCVYGVQASSGAPGESDLVAAIVPTSDRIPDIKSIFKHCIDGLERNSVPTYIQIVREIPKTVSEKSLDRLLREEFRKDADNVHSVEDYK
jgi:acyl-CoA synthetase (AMP-forming)/AMP-acid ligase II